MEEGELLVPIGRIVGAVGINDNSLRLALPIATDI
jgi:hypothetical protein